MDSAEPLTATVVQLAHVGAACGHCARIGIENLQRCSACQRAWFCNSACQKAGWRVHKEACKRLRNLLGPITAACAKTDPPNVDGWKQRCMTLVALLGPGTKLQWCNAIHYEAHCRVCFATRSDGPLRPACTSCYWYWGCTEHVARVAADHSPVDCHMFARSNALQTEIRQFCLSSGAPGINWAPSGIEPVLRGTLPASWQDYLEWRGRDEVAQLPPSFSLALTQNLSQPLTALLAMQKCGVLPQDKTALVIHVVGAAEYDGLPSPVWEEILHQWPGLQALRLHFVGPQLPMSAEVCSGPALSLGTCPECTARGRIREARYTAALYHEFAEAHGYREPDLAIAFNSGVGEEDFESWLPTLQLLIARGIPTCFTAYNQSEAEHAQATLEKLAGCIVQPAAANPFRSEVPFVEPALQDQCYYFNNWYLCLCGKAGDPENAS